MYQFLILLVAVIILGYLLERFLMSILGYHIFRILNAPGIFIHEISHAFFIFIFGGHIKSFQIFKKEGGEVTYTRPIFPLITQPIISIAPVLGCSIVLYFSGKFFGYNFSEFLRSLQIKNLPVIFHFNQFNLSTVVFLYLVLSLTSAMAPSKQDLTNAFWGVLLLISIFLILYYFIPSVNIVFLKLSFIYAIGLYMVVLSLIISLCLWLVKALIKNIFKKVLKGKND